MIFECVKCTNKNIKSYKMEQIGFYPLFLYLILFLFSQNLELPFAYRTFCGMVSPQKGRIPFLAPHSLFNSPFLASYAIFKSPF